MKSGTTTTTRGEGKSDTTTTTRGEGEERYNEMIHLLSEEQLRRGLNKTDNETTTLIDFVFKL